MQKNAKSSAVWDGLGLNEDTEESANDMPVLLISDDDDYDSLEEEFDDDNSRSGKHKYECKNDHKSKLKENST